jgi:DNA-binding MarR family transcriptional regulator
MSPSQALTAERTEMLDRFSGEIRKLSASVVLYASSVARTVGMNSSDMECAQIVARTGPITAGKLSELSGLTTGAITGVVDRLERAGWAKRVSDPKDRRRVIVQPMPRRPEYIEGLYESYGRKVLNLLADYDDRDLALVLGFMERLSRINFEEASGKKVGSSPRGASE